MGKDGQSLPTFVSFVNVLTGRKGGKVLCGAENPGETRTTPTPVKATSKLAISPN